MRGEERTMAINAVVLSGMLYLPVRNVEKRGGFG